MLKKFCIVGCLAIVFAFRLAATTNAQTDKPFTLPIALPPGPSTWLIGQFYGNTTSAYNFGTQWYEAGQGLHFGIDFSMQCGTPIVAVADGEVLAVDAPNFGSLPHNVVLVHRDLGLSTLYGHLLERSVLVEGQPIKQGEVVGLSGEPDGKCGARPHLHLEVRSLDFRTAYNPVTYIDAPWHVLANIGPFANPMFQQDMDAPRRWMSLDDQPDVHFGGGFLNHYASTWPYPLDVRPPVNVIPDRDLGELPAETQWQLRQLGFGGCCPRPWWHPSDSNRLYVVDGIEGQRASVFEYTADASLPPSPVEEAPPMLLSPDGTYQVTRVNGQVTIRRLSDRAEWAVQTQGVLPAISEDNGQLLWEVWRGTYLPGEPAQTVETWVSNLDGSNARMVWLQRGGWSVWLDEARLLIVTPKVDQPDTTLTIYDTRDGSSFVLGVWNWMRHLTVAPGGGRLMFVLTAQPDPAASGIYTIETKVGAAAEQLPWFGGWRWRDANSVYYIPFDVSSSSQILAYYHIPSRTDRYLTDPNVLSFTIANGDWAVSPDGSKIAFTNARDLNMWLLELVRE